VSDKSQPNWATLNTQPGNPDGVSMKALSVVLLGADPDTRRALAEALAGAQATVTKQDALPSRDVLAPLLHADCDVLIVDLNRDTEEALDVVEAACNLPDPITVMVYSRKADPELLVRCMRVGAREFLTDPLSSNLLAEALVRAAARRVELRERQKPKGKALVFVGAKGGCGTTTVATNFAVALAKEGESTVLVDLNLELGIAALTLGLESEFSTRDALQNDSRLDSDLLAKLLVRHNSGLKVLAAPDTLESAGSPELFQPSASSILKLLEILRGDFGWVVVDGGCHYAYLRSLSEVAEKVYVVTQVSIAELRNSNRLIEAYFEGDARRKLEVVFNRFAPRAGEIDEQTISKALRLPSMDVAWKIPNNFPEVQAAQVGAVPLVMKDSPLSRVLIGMAKAACGKTVTEVKKKRFGLFS